MTDRDLRSVQQARDLAVRAREAQAALARFSQEQVDAIVAAMAAATRPEAERLARLAHEETGYGNVADKTRKNLFASEDVAAFIAPMKTVGVLREDRERRVLEIAEPMGPVAAVIPSTNPTSTAIFKALVSIKARDACVLSPHPSAEKCILETHAVLLSAARQAGLPEAALSCMTDVTLEGTQELMKHREIAVILATGGIGLVRAAYSSGKPAYGVGPGNVPVYVDRSADVAQAARDLIAGKTFDFGTLCSSEQAVVCDQAVADALLSELQKNGAHVLSDADAGKVAATVVQPNLLPNPRIVGKPAAYIAALAGVTVAPDTRVLLARLNGVGRDHPLSIEKLSPVLAFYVVAGLDEGIERCRALLRFGGTGHTCGIHAKDDAAIRRFALAQPAFRVVVNTQTSMGATGYATALSPSMSLGCGAWAGNATSDNVTPLHLLHLKRVVWGLPREQRQALYDRPPAPASVMPPPTCVPSGSATAPEAEADDAVDFVAEDDVKRALRAGRTLRLLERAIVTPAARDAASGHRVLVRADGEPWA
ncbi:MAG: aldehyde dehydrogenase family protein [Vicinamibacteria bacterium]|nr:aldehyde dehydrogenase family protein [Vicinamibacteria bacterium]